MSNPSKNLRKIRPDLTPFLFHFTKGDSSESNIKSILNQKKICSKRGYICFTDSPLTMLEGQFSYMDQFSKPMYSRYGIGFKRDILIQQVGCRPVIYGDNRELSVIIDSLQWRCEKLDVFSHDYTWLREWRVNGNEFDFSKINKDDIIVIAPNETALNEIVNDIDVDVGFNYDHSTRQSYPYPVYTIKRMWKGIPLSKAATFKDDNEIEQAMDNQYIGEEKK